MLPTRGERVTKINITLDRGHLYIFKLVGILKCKGQVTSRSLSTRTIHAVLAKERRFGKPSNKTASEFNSEVEKSTIG